MPFYRARADPALISVVGDEAEAENRAGLRIQTVLMLRGDVTDASVAPCIRVLFIFILYIPN